MQKQIFIRLFLIVQMIFVLFSFGCEEKNGLVVDNLRCENLKNPLGIDKTAPRFSWKIKSDRNGTEQKAFQLLVASDPLKLKNNKADLWSSGKIESSASIWVKYKGEILYSGNVAYWKVRVWDEDGNVSPWSPISEFSIGLLNENNWHASYIGLPSDAGFRDCPQLKKAFNLDEVGKRMFLHVNSLGYHEVFLNGEKVSEDILSPAVSQFDKRSLVVTYDVSQLVKKGRNELIIWLGSGWYSEGLPGVTNNGPLVKAQLEKTEKKQREVILITDASWEGRSSEYTRLGRWRSGRYGGEEVNGALVNADLSSSANNSGNWVPVTEVLVPNHKVSPQMAEPNRITETIKPVAITAVEKDTFLVDMGKNLTGWVEIHFSGLKRSQKVVMEYCDHLNEQGQFVDQRQIDRYIASGSEPEVFKNKFNYHGFRYLRISNLKEVPSLDSINAYLIHTDFELDSQFECSDPDLNKIHDMIFYTFRCLSLGGYLVDCPQIERLGYGGDGNASTVTAQTMFDLSPLYNNWLQAWADCIRDDGGMPHTAPCPYPAGGGPYWCGFIITASYNTFLNYGDPLILEKYYPVMQKWLEYVDNYTIDGLLQPWPETDYRGWYLGDWATPEGVDQTAGASVGLVSNCFISVCYDNMQKIAKVLGKPSDAELYSLKNEQLKERIHQTYFDSPKNSYSTGSQIDLTYPLLAKVVPEQLIRGIKNKLVYTIEQTHKGHFACGLVGIPVFTEWVTKNQIPDLMYSMLKKKDYPGYLYMIENGATTTWEHWDGNRSRIHNCYNGVGSWFYQALGGIRPVENIPAYQKIIIQPQIPEGITWAKTSKDTPYGKLVVNWEIIEATLALEIEIPVGVDAEVVIPAGVTNYFLDQRKFDVSGEEGSEIKIKSGKYKIQYSL